jgi:phosphoglycerol transferase MdoB-like AlkP superfamily enzyme
MSSPSPVARIFKPRYFYRFLIFLCALTGFGQMPIYKRYYMADIPGFGWLADFYITRFVHYVGAALLLGLLAYTLADYLLRRREIGAPSWSALARGALLAVVVISGLFFHSQKPGWRLLSAGRHHCR